MAPPAHIRQFEVVFRTCRAIDALDVVRTVAVVAGRVGARLVVDARARVQGLHVAVDMVDDQFERSVLNFPAFGLERAPGLHMAFDTADATFHALAMGRLGDVLVATYAVLLAVHARRKDLGGYVKVTLRAIRCLARESFAPVTAQTAVVGQFGI